LPKVVTQQCLDQDLNPRPTDRKTKYLAVAPPRHIEISRGNRHGTEMVTWHGKEMYYNTKNVLQHKINTKKIKPGSFAFYDIRPWKWRGPILVLALHKSITYLDTYSLTYSPGSTWDTFTTYLRGYFLAINTISELKVRRRWCR